MKKIKVLLVVMWFLVGGSTLDAGKRVPCSAPPAPTNLVAEKVGDQTYFAWVNSYRVQKKDSGRIEVWRSVSYLVDNFYWSDLYSYAWSAWEVVAVLGPTSTAYVDDDVFSEEIRDVAYLVVLYNSCGERAISNSVIVPQ